MSPFGLRLRRLADVVDDYQAAGAPLRLAVERVDEYERAEISATLGFPEACDAVAMRQLASAVTALASTQQSNDARVEPLLRRAVEAIEREAAAREALARGGMVAQAGPVLRDGIGSVRRVALTVVKSQWFGVAGTALVMALIQLAQKCGQGIP